MEFWTPDLIKKSPSFPESVVNQLQKTKSIIFLIQYADEFSTDHSLLDKLKCLKIVLVNKNVIENPTAKCFQHYDLVIFYDGPEYEDSVTGNDAYIDDPENEVCTPEVYQSATEIMERFVLPNISIPDTHVHLTTTAEELVMQVAFLNRKYGLRGIQPWFAKNFVSKIDMIERSKKVQNSAPISLMFKLSRNLSPEEIANNLIKAGLPPYPLFGKPVAASATDNAEKIKNSVHLARWIQNAMDADNLRYNNFLIQEFLEGTFYITETFVSTDGTFHFLCAATSINSWSSMISDVSPAANVYLTEDVEPYQKLEKFSKDFLQEFGAKNHAGIYIIEVIQNSEGHFKLLETCCRPVSGANENLLTQMIFGIDLEALHIGAPLIDDIFFIKSARKKNTDYKSGFSVWYPRKKGMVSEIRNIDIKLPKGAKIGMTKFYYKPGDDVPRNLDVSSDLRCEAFVLTQSFEDAYETAKKFLDFDPVVMK